MRNSHWRSLRRTTLLSGAMLELNADTARLSVIIGIVRSISAEYWSPICTSCCTVGAQASMAPAAPMTVS